jgi:Calcineurin-like phosphoesterase
MRTRKPMSLPVLVLALVAGCAAVTVRPSTPAAVIEAQSAAAPIELPNRDGSLKFLVIGDFGNGSREQLQLAEQMVKTRQKFPFEVAITVGDNIYGSNNPQSLTQRFEVPYKPLLDAGVKFYASLGNHDERELQRLYAPFNMGGEFYYTWKAPHEDVRFFALESGYPTVQQIGWIEREMQSAGEKWKIPYFHHPLYSSGERHGSRDDLKKILEPIFVKNNVSVVFAGHDHVYERTTPQHGIVHFVVGSSGQLRRGNLDARSTITAKGYDTDRAFLVAEIDGDELYFNAISRTGQVVDSGVIVRRQPAPAPRPLPSPSPFLSPRPSLSPSSPASALPFPSPLRTPPASSSRSASR